MDSSNPSSSHQSMALAEVYRVIYYGDEVHLHGAIVATDIDTGYQRLFTDKQLNSKSTRDIALKYLSRDRYMKDAEALPVRDFPTIKNQSHILLNGPIQASIGVELGFCINFYLFGNIHRTIVIPCPFGRSDVFSRPLERTIESEDGNHIISVLYAIFEYAVEARIKVMFTDIKSDFGLYGIITSRTSAIVDPACSSILFFKDEDEKLKLEGGTNKMDISLLRRIVCMPLGSKLVLQFGLFADDNENIVQVSKLIDVENIAHDSTNIYPIPVSCGKCRINVEINWKCKREEQDLL